MRNIVVPQYGSQPIMSVTVGGVVYTDNDGLLDIGNITWERKSKANAGDAGVSVMVDLLAHAGGIGFAGQNASVSITVGQQTTVLLTGRVADDMTVDEDAHTATLRIVPLFETGLYTVDKTSATNPWLNAEDDGKTWPLCFGSVIRQPAVGLNRGTVVTGLTNLTADSLLLEISDMVTLPFDTAFDFSVKNIMCSGQVATDGLHVSAVNKAWYTNLTVTNVAENKLTLADSTKRLVNKWCYMAEFKIIAYCVKQDGAVCTFSPAYIYDADYSGVTTKHKVETNFLNDNSDDPLAITTITTVAGERMASWYPASIVVDSWTISQPYDIYVRSGTDGDTYVFNTVATARLAEIVGKRERGRYMQMSRDQYAVALNHTPTGTTDHLGVVTFDASLSEVDDSKWVDEGVFVSLESSLDGNVSDVIKYLLETYTTFSCDSGSFDNVKTETAALPTGFAITKPENALTLCEDIAWQACCTLIVKGSTAYLKYLPTEPSDVTDITDYVKDSLMTSTTQDTLYKRFDFTWRRAGYERERHYKKQSTGIPVLEADFSIYNVFERVKKSADFWYNRLSKRWVHKTFDLPVSGLNYELFDWISYGSVRGQVIGVSYDPKTYRTTITAELASSNGSSEDATYWLAEGVPGPLNPLLGINEVSYVRFAYNSAEDEGTLYEIRVTDSGPSPATGLKLRQVGQIGLGLYVKDGTDIVKRNFTIKPKLYQPAGANYKIYKDDGTEMQNVQLVNGQALINYYFDSDDLSTITESNATKEPVTVSFGPLHNATTHVLRKNEYVAVPQYTSYVFSVEVDSTISITEMAPVFMLGETYYMAFEGPSDGKVVPVFPNGIRFSNTDGSDIEYIDSSSTEYTSTWKYTGRNFAGSWELKFTWSRNS